MEFREMLLRKDIGYAASFEPKDAELVQKFMDKINVQEHRVQELFDKFDRVYDDHKVKNFEPIVMAKSGNKIVNEGLIALAEFQVGKRSKQFDHYVIGDDNTAVAITDDRCWGECARTSIIKSGGNFIQRQSTLYYSVFFDKNIPDCTVRETAIADSINPNADRILLRTVIPAIEGRDGIPHRRTWDTTFVGHIIYSGSA